jgi:potassium-transporting ATPase KdpC subunit
MIAHLRANLWLLVLTVTLCSVSYPLVLLGLGQTVFRDKAQGSLLTDAQGNPVGARPIAQPFTGDEFFQPRPSAVAYNAAASGASNWAASNYLLRDRVARQLGPIAQYADGEKKGQRVGPDMEAWFQQDRFGGKPGIVAQWATMHPAVAQNWVKADKLHAAYVAAWQQSHQAEVAQWIKDDPDTPHPTPEELAVPFFTQYAQAHPGTFPVAVEHQAEGKPQKAIEPVQQGAEIQAAFFDMWLQEHPGANLRQVPADMVMASGSGLDPDITLDNALWQLDRVAAAWAKRTATGEDRVHRQIERLLHDKCYRPLGGLAGVPLVNVLELNLALQELRFQR